MGGLIASISFGVDVVIRLEVVIVARLRVDIVARSGVDIIASLIVGVASFRLYIVRLQVRTFAGFRGRTIDEATIKGAIA